MTAGILVEFYKGPRFTSSPRSIERVLLATKQLVERRRKGWISEIYAPILGDPLNRAEKEDLVFPDRPPYRKAIVKSAEVRGFRFCRIQGVRRIESLVAMKQ